MSGEKKNKVMEFFNKFLTPEQKLAFKKEFGEIPITPVVTPTPAAMTEAKLKDGTVIKYDAPTLVEGVTVMVVGTDLTELPAPDGDWELEDGTIITTVGGKITAIQAVAAVDPAAPVVQSATPEPNKLVEALKTLMEGRFAEMNKTVEALTTENIALKAEFAKQATTLNTVAEFFNAIGEIKTGEVPANTELNKGSKNALSYLPKK